MQSLFTGLYTKFSGSAFATAIGNKMYLAEAPQNITFPYCTYHLLTNTYDWQFALNGQFEEAVIQFSIFSTSFSAIEVETLYDSLIALYDWSAISVTGYTHLYMRRESSSLRRDETDKYWQKDVFYRILLEKT